jgi:hypothetical protein
METVLDELLGDRERLTRSLLGAAPAQTAVPAARASVALCSPPTPPGPTPMTR